MDKREIIEALRQVDARLPAPCDVLLIGGAAMILHFGARRATQDIDVVVLRGDARALRDAARSVARERGLPEYWMSDAAKGFADILPADFARRIAALDVPFTSLRLYVLGRAEQAALKMAALREQDLEDLELLLPQMGPGERENLRAVVDHIGTIRPDWAQRIRYFLLEQGWEIE